VHSRQRLDPHRRAGGHRARRARRRPRAGPSRSRRARSTEGAACRGPGPARGWSSSRGGDAARPRCNSVAVRAPATPAAGDAQLSVAVAGTQYKGGCGVLDTRGVLSSFGAVGCCHCQCHAGCCAARCARPCRLLREKHAW
ncbi:hypothetical protein AURDEDRAFT_186555, partial [Auricularia subglabra TFB-10046 SS5]